MLVIASRLQVHSWNRVACAHSMLPLNACILATSLTHRLAIGALALPVVSIACIGLYVVKSALGIDLFDGPSIFHDAFYI